MRRHLSFASFCILAIALVGVASMWLSRNAHAAEPAPAVTIGSPISRHLIAFDNGNVIQWGNAARMRRRSSRGEWSDISLSEVDHLRLVVPDMIGLLVAGTKDRAEDATGRDPWPAVATDPLMELLPNGKLDERAVVEPRGRIVSFRGGRTGRTLVECVPADNSKLHWHPAYCVASGPDGWRKIGNWDSYDPFVCGRFLIEISSGYPFDAGQNPLIAIRRLDDGKVIGNRVIGLDQAVSCGGAGELLIGKTDVRGLSLPNLGTLWRLPFRGHVMAIARESERVLVATPSGNVVTLTAPQKNSKMNPNMKPGDPHAAH